MKIATKVVDLRATDRAGNLKVVHVTMTMKCPKIDPIIEAKRAAAVLAAVEVMNPNIPSELEEVVAVMVAAVMEEEDTVKITPITMMIMMVVAVEIIIITIIITKLVLSAIMMMKTTTEMIFQGAVKVNEVVDDEEDEEVEEVTMMKMTATLSFPTEEGESTANLNQKVIIQINETVIVVVEIVILRINILEPMIIMAPVVVVVVVVTATTDFPRMRITIAVVVAEDDAETVLPTLTKLGDRTEVNLATTIAGVRSWIAGEVEVVARVT